MNARAIKKKFAKTRNYGYGAEYREVYISVRSGMGVLIPGKTLDELQSERVHPSWHDLYTKPIYTLPLYWTKDLSYLGEWSGRDWWSAEEKIINGYWKSLCSEIRCLSNSLGTAADLRVHRNPPVRWSKGLIVNGRKELEKRGYRNGHF